MTKLQFTVNGKPVEWEGDPERKLADVLRYDLGLTGVKVGCGEGRCGACMALITSPGAAYAKATQTCTYPVRKAAGAEIVTIEGLAQDGKLHPVQEAFIKHGAFQCGFCTPGVIISAVALLQKNSHPTDEEIRSALRSNLCRCTGYNSIVQAIRAAAGAIQAVELPGLRAGASTPPLRVIGQPLPRPDAVAKVTGAALYTDDYTFPGLLHGATLRANIPHARIKRIVTGPAKALPGVLAVLTSQDVPGRNRHGAIIPDWPVLCDDKVRYVGDAVAIVAAETPEIAEAALKLIEVEYEPLPVAADARAARLPGAPLVHEDYPLNVLQHLPVTRGNVAEGLAQAEVVIEKDYQTPCAEHAFLEPECAIGRVTEDGRIEIRVGSQIPYGDRAQVAAALGVPPEQVRVLGTVLGGGFGGKEDITAQIHVALLARATGRPVKILYSRAESLLVHPKRHATFIHLKLGAKRDGTLTVLEEELVGDAGAYASLSTKVMARAASHASGPYDIANVQINCDAVYTNNPPAGAFRGFGVAQSAFAVESALDELAAALAMDPVELRRKNLLRVGGTTCTGQVLRESVGLEECFERVLAALREDQGLAEGEPIRWAWQEQG